MVIGGGPAGYAGAIAAGRQGKSVLLFEGGHVGGTCLNVGCIPTKYLLDKAGMLERIREMTEMGIFKDAGKFSFSKIQKGREAVVKKLVGGVAYLLKSCGVTVVNGFAELTAPGEAICDGKKYTARYTLIASGSKPIEPPIEGLKGNSIGSTEALALEKVPKKLLVIGGGVIGLELASAYHAYGSKVIVLEMLDKLMPGEDYESMIELAKILKSKGIDIRTSTKVKKIENRGSDKLVHFEDGSGMHSVQVDAVLLAAGRKASLKGIDAAKLGLKLDERGNILVDGFMRTNLTDVYAAGDAAGGWQLAHSAYTEAETAIENMFGEQHEASLSVMPRCIYTLPPYAAVGMTRQQADKKGIACKVGQFKYSANGMALVEDASEGTARVLLEEATGKILGVQMVGLGATEMIATAAMAIASGVTAKQWSKMITAHPSLSEILHEAVQDSLGNSLHTPLKKR